MFIALETRLGDAPDMWNEKDSMKGKGEKPFCSSQKQWCVQNGKAKGVESIGMWCTLCFVSGTLVMPLSVLQNEQQKHKLCVSVTEMVKHQRHTVVMMTLV